MKMLITEIFSGKGIFFNKCPLGDKTCSSSQKSDGDFLLP